MQKVLVPIAVSARDRSVFSHAPAAPTWRHSYAQQGRPDHQFVALLHAYRDSGGLAREQEVVALSRRRGGPDADALANWIAEKAVIGFEWQSQTWLPLFQFKRFDMARQPALGQVLAELTSVYDRWELASWFAQPNPWLADRLPADMFELDLSAVQHAARADRWLAIC